MWLNGHCEVCDRERDVAVAALPYAPMSTTTCRECLNNEAFPLWTLHGLFDMVDGVDNVADWLKGVRSFKEGNYIDWAEIVASYVPTPMEVPE